MNPPAGVVLDSLDVSVGEGEVFVPLVDDAVVELIRGGQGARMLPVRIRAIGRAPECLAQSTQVSVGGQLGGFSDYPLRTYVDGPARTTKPHYIVLYVDVTVGTRLTLTVTAGGKSVVRQVWFAARPDGGQ